MLTYPKHSQLNLNFIIEGHFAHRQMTKLILLIQHIYAQSNENKSFLKGTKKVGNLS